MYPEARGGTTLGWSEVEDVASPSIGSPAQGLGGHWEEVAAAISTALAAVGYEVSFPLTAAT
jgi:hypothetical protein